MICRGELTHRATDYLEPAQLSQWRWPELSITSDFTYAPSKRFHPPNGWAAITLGFATHSSYLLVVSAKRQNGVLS